MNVVYAMTRHVYGWFLPAIRSLAAHHPDARVFILAEDDELPYELPMPAEVINVSEQSYFPKYGVNYFNSFKYINLLKVRLPSLLPVDRVFYLDIDTIVCDSLDELWNTDLEGKWLGACPEYRGQYRPFGNTYYNMGVAIINLKQMREDGAEEPMNEYLNTVRQPYADQDAWNKFGLENDKFATIDIRYNESMVTGTTQNPAIVHYCAYKDWWTRFNMPRVQYLNEYRKDLQI